MTKGRVPFDFLISISRFRLIASPVFNNAVHLSVYQNQRIYLRFVYKKHLYPLYRLHYTTRYDIIIVKFNQNFVGFYQNEKEYAELSGYAYKAHESVLFA